jgi:glucoselysine-6-phosphate deglycase
MEETMLTYVKEEPEVLTRILAEFDFQGVMAKLPKQVNKILILATGSSLNAALSAKYFMEKYAEVNVTIEEPFNFQHYGRFDEQTDLILAISQSGKSTSTINVLMEMKKYQLPMIALTSNQQSPLVEVATYALDLNVGEEKVGYVTKGFSGTVMNLFLITSSIAQHKQLMTTFAYEQLKKELMTIIEELPQLIERSLQFFEENRDRLIRFTRLACIGYGANLGIAKEFETKFTETVRLPSTGYELEAYMHGPYLEARKNHLLFFLIDQKENKQRAYRLRNYLQQYVGDTLTIVNQPHAGHSYDFSLATACDNDLLLPLLYVVPQQIWSYQTAEALGLDLAVDPFPDFDQQLNSKLI